MCSAFLAARGRVAAQECTFSNDMGSSRNFGTFSGLPISYDTHTRRTQRKGTLILTQPSHGAGSFFLCFGEEEGGAVL